ncbi:MAG: hypothetical protein K0Q63_3000 [Paenibacillus sp.]|nr:hypothetical protein [Paenibacillus sp.]
MPFTFAHPLYAAPLKLAKPGLFSLTGLILGSMSPDFEYFMALEPRETIGHSLEGLFRIAMPFSVTLALIFHYMIKEPLAACLPSAFGMDARAKELIKRYEWKLRKISDLLLFLLSVAIGFGSHVLIDAFTHRSGYFAARIGLLQEELLGFPAYKLLQHGSTLLGLAVQAIIVYLIFRKIKFNESTRSSSISRGAKIGYWSITAGIMILTVVLKLTLADSPNLIGMLVVSSITGCLLGLWVASILIGPWIVPRNNI